MKLAIAFTLLTLSLGAFAQNYQVVKTSQCKTEAATAAYYKYKSDTGNGHIQTRAQMKSVQEGNVLHHMIDIIEFDTGARDMITVSVDAKTCRILEVN